MANFINTIDVLGDDAVIDSIINRTITEYKDNTITKVGTYAFSKCTALVTVDVPNADYLANFAFSGCTALKTVNIPNVTTISDSVFASCEKLESVTAPKLTTLNSSDFRDCKALKSVKLPALEKIVGSSNFAGCTALERADFAKLSAIGGGTQFNNCTSLTALILRNAGAVVTLGNASSVPNTTYIYVPASLHSQYAVASNWSNHADKLRKLEEWTVDNTVTGELINDAANKHIVRFYNSDGTLLSYTYVTDGGNAVYSGATPVDPTGAYPFDGFTPAPENVTADMDCYATFKDPWYEVLAAIDDGTYKTKYALGDTVPLNLGSEGIVDMQIIGFDADDLADGSGKAAITWSARVIPVTKHRMNPALVTNGDGTYQDGTGAIGGWEKCELRSYIKDTIKPLIPYNVRNAIKEVTKTQPAYDTTGAAYTQTTTDDVWILANDETDAFVTPYRYYGVTGRLDKYEYTNGGEIKTNWWTRSAYGTDKHIAYLWGSTRQYKESYNSYGVALCFCT